MSAFLTHLMSPIVNKGEKLYDSSSFAFSVLRGAFPKGEKFLGVSGVRFWIPPCDRGS